jgi:hypothetical protein
MVEEEPNNCYDCSHNKTGNNLLPKFQTQKMVIV